MNPVRSSSLFDEIFRLQNPAPDVDLDPEDQDDGLQAQVVEGSKEEGEALGSSYLRKRAAIINSDPRYQGKTTARKDLYSDGKEEDLSDKNLATGNALVNSGGSSDSERDEDGEEEEDMGSDAQKADSDIEDGSDEDQSASEEQEMDVTKNADEGASTSVVLPSTKADDREKGKIVHHQIGIWDDLMRSRISLQKVVQSCNRLPQPDTWPEFVQQSEAFRLQARNVHSSVRKLVAALLGLQQLLSSEEISNNAAKAADSDEEITSESEGEDEETVKPKKENTNVGDDLEDEEEEEQGEDEEGMVNEKDEAQSPEKERQRQKRKLDVEEVEETLSKRHRDFQDFRNSTLSKWDEKTRLSHSKVRAKNFAAFEMSVLKQIEQVLVNRERLVKRIHQSRSGSRVLGCIEKEEQEDSQNKEEEVDVDDDEEEVEMTHRKRSEVAVDHEIIDDNDFYHVCLRDMLENKQNEELDPVTASKQRLEIQRLRNKQKKKVDTRASKGRKIRYHVKEKLKNYMTPYDKSAWSDQQKDDLFKALFGGHQLNTADAESMEIATINIGL